VSDPRRFISSFRERFGIEPQIIVRSPGRVEIIGGHTDYNDGFVLPMAIEREAVMLAARRTDRTIRIYSDLFDETCEFEVSADLAAGKPSWANYAKGVAALLARAGKKLVGLDVLVSSTIPSGGGLSSSAALEVGYGRTMLAAAGETMDPVQLGLLAQKAEHDWAGAPCGIMDQFICVLGRAGHALLLDCRSQEFEHVAMAFDHAALLIADTRVKHDLGNSEYPVRRAQCEKAAAIIGRHERGVAALRDVDAAMLEKYKGRLDPLLYRRARHVVGEDQRVMEAAAGFRSGDLAAAGDAMNRSHESARDDYEISCEELNFLVDRVRECEGVYGARMSGGAFGGCIVALIDTARGEAIEARLTETYEKRFNISPGIFVTAAAGGAEVLQS